MSNNPNDPYSLNSQWNPLTGEYEPSPYYQTPPPGQRNLGFSQFQYTPQPFSQPQYQPRPQPQPQPNMTPEEYAQFLAWRNSQTEASVEETNPTPTSSKKQTNVQPSSSNKGKKKSKNQDTQPKQKKVILNANKWEPEDELRLAKSWIQVSENPDVGIDQDRNSFWYLVMHAYNSRNPPFVRGKDALSSKWTKLNGGCQKWMGIWTRMKDNDQRSGEQAEDFMARVHEQYTHETGKHFPHILAWNYLKNKPKWLNPDPFVIGRRNVPKRRETVDLEDLEFGLDEPEDEPNPNEGLYGPDPLQRPPGKTRKPKSQKTDSGSNSSRASFDDAITTTFEGLRNDKKGFYRTKDLHEKLKILAMPTEGLPEQVKNIMEMEKMKIAEEMGWNYGPGSGSGSGSGSGAGNA